MLQASNGDATLAEKTSEKVENGDKKYMQVPDANISQAVRRVLFLYRCEIHLLDKSKLEVYFHVYSILKSCCNCSFYCFAEPNASGVRRIER